MVKLIEKREDFDKWINGRGGLWAEMYEKGYDPIKYQTDPKAYPQFDALFDKISEAMKLSDRNEKAIERLENKTGLTEAYALSQMNQANSRLSQSYAGMTAYLPMPEKFAAFLAARKMTPSVYKPQTLINDLKAAMKYIKDNTKIQKYTTLIADLELAAKYIK